MTHASDTLFFLAMSSSASCNSRGTSIVAGTCAVLSSEFMLPPLRLFPHCDCCRESQSHFSMPVNEWQALPSLSVLLGAPPKRMHKVAKSLTDQVVPQL